MNPTPNGTVGYGMQGNDCATYQPEAESSARPSQLPDDDDSTRAGFGAAPRKVDVSHFPHYGLKRGMACTFCRRRKLRCSGDRPTCTNCVKYTKVCEYGPPIKEQKKKTSSTYEPSPQPTAQQVSPTVLHGSHTVTPSDLAPPSLFNGQAPLPINFEYFGTPSLPMDQSLMTPSTGMSFQPSPFSDFQQQSPFVSPPLLTPTPLAQPVIGMPPFVAAPEYNTFPIPGTNQQQHQQWIIPDQFGPMPVEQVQRMSSASASISRLPSDPTTPDDPPPKADTSNPDTPASSTGSRPTISGMYRQTPSLLYGAEANVVDGITDRLGEFLFSPSASAVREDEIIKRRKPRPRAPSPGSVSRMRLENDGLQDSTRTLLLDCFLAHASLFFEMSVARFKYRMTFTDRRRPSLALLNAMYLWATRLSNSPQMSHHESGFFEQAYKHLEVSTSTVDRLMDAVRAAMLLSAYSHSSGRHHEGWCLAGLAVRLVLSCGLHRIRSCTVRSEEPKNPFLRNRFFLLPPAEDSIELGERIHAFWAVFAMDRGGSLATGHPSGLRDEDITTPFGRPLSDIASGNVTEQDDITVRDLYRGSSTKNDPPYTTWVKIVAILERSAKICFLEPAENSAYTAAWNEYSRTPHRDPSHPKPPEYFNQPRYRNPIDYQECLLAIDQLVNSIGDEGIWPVDRKFQAGHDSATAPVIPTKTLMLHHMICAVRMVLHDINSVETENPEALKEARKSVMLFRSMPQIPFTEVDAFAILVWSMIAKVLIKEVLRLSLLGDHDNAHIVTLEADTIIDEIARIGQTMWLARTQANAMTELKRTALSAGDKDAGFGHMDVPHLEMFLFPEHM